MNLYLRAFLITLGFMSVIGALVGFCCLMALLISYSKILGFSLFVLIIFSVLFYTFYQGLKND